VPRSGGPRQRHPPRLPVRGILRGHRVRLTHTALRATADGGPDRPPPRWSAQAGTAGARAVIAGRGGVVLRPPAGNGLRAERAGPAGHRPPMGGEPVRRRGVAGPRAVAVPRAPGASRTAAAALVAAAVPRRSGGARRRRGAAPVPGVRARRRPAWRAGTRA